MLNQRRIIERLTRLQGNMSTSDFARRIGCSRSLVAQIYRGKRNAGPTIMRFLGLEPVRPSPFESTRMNLGDNPKCLSFGRAAIETFRHSGIYIFLSENGEVLYVGQTSSLGTRFLAAGHPIHRRLSEVDSLTMIRIPGEALDDVESTLIACFRPKYNGADTVDRAVGQLHERVRDAFFGNKDQRMQPRYVVPPALWVVGDWPIPSMVRAGPSEIPRAEKEKASPGPEIPPSS